MGHDARTLDEGGRWWTEDEARTVLAELAKSGESLAAFARTRGLPAQRLRYWKKRIGAAKSVPAFLPVSWPAAAPTASGAPMMEIVTGGITLRVREDLDVEHLARIVTALADRKLGC